MMVTRESSDDELVAYCLGADCEIISKPEYSTKVVKLADKTVVKFGPGVARQEAINLEEARRLLKGIVGVPQIYRFFTDEHRHGYIVMEYIQGDVIEPLEDPEKIGELAKRLAKFATIKGSKPGSLRGGNGCGFFFDDAAGRHAFDTVQDLEQWFNRRLSKSKHPPLCFEDPELVLCHLDLAPRNIIWTENGNMYILDWASAGFYPRVCELSSLWHRRYDDETFTNILFQAIGTPSQTELEQIHLILCAVGNNLKYSFPEEQTLAPDPLLSRRRHSMKKSAIHGAFPLPPLPAYPAEWIARVDQLPPGERANMIKSLQQNGATEAVQQLEALQQKCSKWQLSRTAAVGTIIIAIVAIVARLVLG